MTWDDLVRLASELPEVVEATSYGTPALKAGGKLLTRVRPELASVVFFDVPIDERAMLIEAQPGLFHTIPHYANHPSVLARLEPLEPRTARHFLERRWRRIAPRRIVRARGGQ